MTSVVNPTVAHVTLRAQQVLPCEIYKPLTVKLDHWSGFPHSTYIVLGMISF